MKTTGMLCVLLFAACGSSKKAADQPQMATENAAPAEDPAVMANPTPPPAVDEPKAGADGDKVSPAEFAPMTPPPAPVPMVALAMLTSVKDGADVGSVSFELGDGNMIAIQGDFNGLPPGKHAIYVHEGGDCGGKAKKIGGHLDPTNSKHGPPSSATRHAGDFGNIEVDKKGAATFAMSTDSLSFEAGRADTVTGRTIAVHAKADNAKGNAGPVIACGVISLRQ